MSLALVVDDYVPKPKAPTVDGKPVTLYLPRELLREIDLMVEKLGFKKRSPMIADVLAEWIRARKEADRKHGNKKQ